MRGTNTPGPVWENRFGLQVINAIDTITNHPARFAKIHGELRRVRVPSFPYHVYYEAAPEMVMILGVFHFRRDPLTVTQQINERTIGLKSSSPI